MADRGGWAAGYGFSLEQQSLRRSVTELGDPSLLAPLLKRLSSPPSPFTIGVLGASVAQNGGCVSQSGKRCMAFRGARPLQMMYGGKQPHKGFAVRLLELLNSSAPDPDHRLINAALDGTPAQAKRLLQATPLPSSHAALLAKLISPLRAASHASLPHPTPAELQAPLHLSAIHQPPLHLTPPTL